MPLGGSISALPAVGVANVVVGLSRTAAILAVADRTAAVGRRHANALHEGTVFLRPWAGHGLESEGQNEKNLE